MTAYDPRGQTWGDWSALTAELFPRNRLPRVDEVQWREFAEVFHATAPGGMPHHQLFPDWQTWAQALCGALNVRR